ncbi:MAG: AraC family transcriptional regulator [Oscillospiraceae bacterium]|jgi:AraC-like DNA-binding protein|nr:AraC family transcriptional regulator [Oscillospiraceae bacterium]
MRGILDYIERNLRAELTARDLADLAGYSSWHFCRLFAQSTGQSVGGYLQQRRLDRALEEISQGRSGVGAALEYGFDTYAGFYKAFVRRYGCAPKRYLALYGPHTSHQEGRCMKNYTKNELRTVLAHWDIPQNLPLGDVCIMDGTQVSGNVWRVGEDFILKASPREPLLRHLHVAEALAAQGLPALLPVPAKDGAAFLEGDPVFLLSRSLAGAPLPKEDRFGPNRGGLRREVRQEHRPAPPGPGRRRSCHPAR